MANIARDIGDDVAKEGAEATINVVELFQVSAGLRKREALGHRIFNSTFSVPIVIKGRHF